MRLAHQFSVVNPRVRVDAIRWSLFKDLADARGITGVPAMVVNDSLVIEEELNENALLRVVLSASQQ